MMNSQLSRSPWINPEELTTMLRKQSAPCISIIVRQQSEMNQRKQNGEILRQAVSKARSALDRYACPAAIRESMAGRLDELVGGFESDHVGKGLGLFVSRHAGRVLSFPFQVNEMVLVADSFESRDILYLRQYLAPYYVLSLTKRAIHFFRGLADSLVEIRNEKFPLEYKDDHEYARSSVGSSVGYGMKGFEKDKSVLSEIRTKAFVKDAAHHLSPYVSDPESELVVAGPARLVGDFVSTFPAKGKIISKVSGSSNGAATKDFTDSVWSACQGARKRKIEALIGNLNDLGLNYKVSGIRDVWAAAVKGKGHLLLVERDFQRRAYLPDGGDQIRLHPPKGKYTTITDVVDDVIEKVIWSGGKIVFTETNQLQKFQCIGLILRYK